MPNTSEEAMRCPNCQSNQTRVLESRQAASGRAVRRRRECSACGRRFTTFERYERGALTVRKRGGTREPFDREKLTNGLMRALHKRSVAPGTVEAIVDRIESEVESAGGELPAEAVGELALRGLRLLDPVGYVRFASVYRDFASPEEFEAELRRLDTEPPLEQSEGLFDPEDLDTGGAARVARQRAGSVRSDRDAS